METKISKTKEKVQVIFIIHRLISHIKAAGWKWNGVEFTDWIASPLLLRYANQAADLPNVYCPLMW